MKDLFNIEAVLDTIVGNIDKEKNNLNSQIQKVFFENIDEDLNQYLSFFRITNEELVINVSNANVFSEIVGFRKNIISKKMLPFLLDYGIKSIKFKKK